MCWLAIALTALTVAVTLYCCLCVASEQDDRMEELENEKTTQHHP